MKRGNGWIEKFAKEADLQGEAFPGQSVIELFSDKRVLIEHHRGVSQYSECEITIRLKFGLLRICGSQLELAKMSSHQLIITGRINAMHIMRREIK